MMVHRDVDVELTRYRFCFLHFSFVLSTRFFSRSFPFDCPMNAIAIQVFKIIHQLIDKSSSCNVRFRFRIEFQHTAYIRYLTYNLVGDR